EFRTYGHTPEDVHHAAAEAAPLESPLLARKLHDLALLYRDYVAHIADRYADPDCLLGEAAQRLRHTNLLQGAQVWVDGFAGFTPQEMRMLGALCSVADRVRVALCLDPRRLSPVPSGDDSGEEGTTVFRQPVETAREL